MSKTEAASILARSATRAGATASNLSAHLSELAHTAEPGSLIAQALTAQPALSTIRKSL